MSLITLLEGHFPFLLAQQVKITLPPVTGGRPRTGPTSPVITLRSAHLLSLVRHGPPRPSLALSRAGSTDQLTRSNHAAPAFERSFPVGGGCELAVPIANCRSFSILEWV